MRQPVPVTILTGFLGAGKTTLMRHLLTEAHGLRIAVIVNEFGDLGFDGALIKACDAPACAPGDIVELTNGCICCTLADDFIPTMQTLLDRPQPLDAILIETSGLALPQPLVKAFQWPSIAGRASVDAVLTLVDALALSDGRLTLNEAALAAERAAADDLDHDDPIAEVFDDQLACADLVVLTKCDLVDAATLNRIEAELGARDELANKAAGVKILRSSGALDPRILMGLARAAEADLGNRHGHHGEGADHEHDDFESTVLHPAPAPSREIIAARAAAALAIDGVLRVKGYAAIDGKSAPVIVQGVGTRVETAFAPAGAAQALGLVVIGTKGFDIAAARAALSA